MISPITPPPELVEEWFMDQRGLSEASRQHITTQAARWGWDQRGAANEAELQKAADQELEAILEMVGFGQQSLPEEDRYLDGFTVASIRAARRPKPPSLKEQALARLTPLEKLLEAMGHCPDNTIRRALEALPND